MKFLNKKSTGFTLIEIMVVIGVIGILSAIIFASFSEARQISRDKARTTSLKELQLAIEFYKAQYGEYPAQGCGTPGVQFAGPTGKGNNGFIKCADYITGLVPDFMAALPTESAFNNESERGFFYRSDGNSFKLMAYDVVEQQIITSHGNEFSRCPVSAGCSTTAWSTTYAVYSSGAELW